MSVVPQRVSKNRIAALVLAGTLAYMSLLGAAPVGFLASGILGILLIRAICQANPLEIAASVALGILILACQLAAHLRTLDYFSVATALGCATFLVVAVRVRTPEDLKQLLMLFALPFFVLVTTLAENAPSLFIPSKVSSTFDPMLYAFDEALGVNTFGIARFALAHRWLATWCAWVYANLPLTLALVWAVQLRAGRRARAWALVVACCATGIMGFLLYQVLPGTGPRYLFEGTFPWGAVPRAGSLAATAALSTAYTRNAVPSLHVTWAALAAWYSAGAQTAVKALTIGFALLTVLATLTTGEHYVVDLLVAAPFFAAMICLACPSPSLRRLGGISLAITLAWTLALQHRWASSVAAWGVVLGAATWSALVIARVAHDQFRCEPASATSVPTDVQHAASSGQ
jgi:hypothetical protein